MTPTVPKARKKSDTSKSEQQIELSSWDLAECRAHGQLAAIMLTESEHMCVVIECMYIGFMKLYTSPETKKQCIVTCERVAKLHRDFREGGGK